MVGQLQSYVQSRRFDKSTFPIAIHEKREDTYTSVGGPESVDLLLCLGELVLGCQRLQDLKDEIPELLVLLVKQDDETCRLRVEG